MHPLGAGCLVHRAPDQIQILIAETFFYRATCARLSVGRAWRAAMASVTRCVTTELSSKSPGAPYTHKLSERSGNARPRAGPRGNVGPTRCFTEGLAATPAPTYIRYVCTAYPSAARHGRDNLYSTVLLQYDKCML